MSAYSWAWLAWGSLFLVIEGVALADRDPGDTLSEHVWKWCRVKGAMPSVTGWVLRGALAVFMAWLSLHLVLGWPPNIDPRSW